MLKNIPGGFELRDKGELWAKTLVRDKGELWAKTLEPEQQGLRHHGAVWFWPQTNVSNRREWR